MKVKFGALVVDGRGKIGGHVASKNRAGAYLRTKVTPVNPNTTSQAAARARFAGISVDWRGLTDDQRKQWNGAVSAFSKTDIFGDLRNPTGANLHQRLNNNLVFAGEAQISVPPVPASVETLTSLSVAATNGADIIATFAATPVPADHKLVIKATPAISPGISFVKSEFRHVKTLAPAAMSPDTFTTDYEAKFGAIGAAGQKIFVEAFYINTVTGQAGVALQASAIIA